MWPQSSWHDGLSLSLSFRQSRATSRRGWAGSIKPIWDCWRSISGISTLTLPEGILGPSITIIWKRSPGLGNWRIMIWTHRTPKEKLSSFSVYTGGSESASGDMYTIAPGHWVRGWGGLSCGSHHKASPFQSLSLWLCCLRSATHYCLIGLDEWCHWSGGRRVPGLCHGRDSLQCGKGVAFGIAPGIRSDSHPLAPLGIATGSLESGSW